VIAGGHSLLPMMKLRLAKPEHLIDINNLTELAKCASRTARSASQHLARWQVSLRPW
jgi:CO/xanthine dehydrogenase FAD-binding subunit